jgi:AAA+ superfamily predicted ATPase
MDSSVITAIAAAVQASPENLALRAHLATLLAQAERWLESLEQAQTTLARQPDHLEALGLAAQACETLGEHERAESYRRLLTALGGKLPESVSSASSSASESHPSSVSESRPSSVPDLNSIPKFTDDGRPIQRISDNGTTDPDTSDFDTGGSPERIKLRSNDDNEILEYEVEGPKVTLADVAGMQQVKRRLNLAFLAPMRNPELMKAFGKTTRGGLLMYGPPGCGKTFIARATAGELGAHFLAVGLSDVLDMYVGNSEKNLHEIFETARRKSPCVLFLDEIDALGRKRSQMRNSNGNVINQLLSEMDGVNAKNEGVFVLAATNHPWDVDTALRRPGRLDRTLLVLPPDLEARASLLEMSLRDRPVQNIDVNSLAKTTEDFSGADLAHLADSASELAMEDSMTTGRVRSITMNDFKSALKDVRPSTRAWFETAKNYAMFANDAGQYDDLLEYLKAKKMM